MTPEPSSNPVPTWPLHGLVALTVLGAALLGGATAGVLVMALNWSPVLAASLGAAVGLALASLPLVAMALRSAETRPARPASAAGSDPLADSSGAATRVQFLDMAEREWARARRYGSGAAVLLVDVDRYGRLSDTHGPAAGDAALHQLIHHTLPTLRGADVLARFGASQLAVFLAHADTTGALDVAERIRERAESFEVTVAGAPNKMRFTVSVGSASLRPSHLNLQTLIMDAEDAVLAARQAGGNCVRSAPVDALRPSLPAPGRGERRARRK